MSERNVLAWNFALAFSLAISGMSCALGTSSPGDIQRDKADFYVAPEGNDSNQGTKNEPFATIARARDEVRKKIATGLTRDMLVLIRGGTYEQAATLEFGPKDSGTDKCSITYAAWPGEKVLVSGGRNITGWKKGQGEIWTCELPEVKAGQWYFRQLFVNGQRAVRARTPNADDKTPWWAIRTSTAKKDSPLPEDGPIALSVTGPIREYKNPGDVELVYIDNNGGGRKRLGTIDEKQQTFTLALPHRWNSRKFTCDWNLSVPYAGKACYLENALEMLDRPGEWYLDRQTGVLSYWPRANEDMRKADVVAPAVRNTLLAVIGTLQRPVMNLHFEGIDVEYAEWPLPAWGYMGMFCCNVAIPKEPNPGHRFTEAAVEYEHARSCTFVDGGIGHAGAMGLCLREGTENIIIEGNEIFDLGGGGIGAGYPNVAYGYLNAAPPPGPDEYKGYRIANNYVHHCGMIDYSAAGICLFSSQDSVIAHNLIHDTAYFGIGFAGSQDPKVPFAGNNTVEYNHVHDAMKVTVDGAAIYSTFAQHGRGVLIRGNLLHDIVPNRFNGQPMGGVSGIYLDGWNDGCRYEDNVVFNASCPLNLYQHGANVSWRDNIFLQNGAPPPEFIEAAQARAGLEPAYRRRLLRTEAPPCHYCSLIEEDASNASWSAGQFDLPQTGGGVVRVFRRAECKQESLRVKPRGLIPSALYDLKASVADFDPKNKMCLSGVAPAGKAAVLAEGKVRMPGRQLMEDGLLVRLTARPQVAWVVYERVKDR